MTSIALPPGFTSLPTFEPDEAIQQSNTALGPQGIRAYRHINSGLRIVLFSAPGPLVSATIVVGTQPVSHAGHPHTLEHIVFLGSHNHPRRGYLDNLACRCLAGDTNAWTDNDYTAYTATTAGFTGFSQLLPVFLDHVLRPNISDPAFASEVYHVRADGKEAGVVFCEMQARENTEADLRDQAIRSTLLADTTLAFESGGRCHDIRTLTNEEIFRFHKDQYCGANVTVIVGGSSISPYELLSCMAPLLDEIASAPGFTKGKPQWHSSLDLAPLPPISRLVVPFPCPDEDIGTVTFGWRGPGTSEYLCNTAIGVMLRYLAGDVWSPFQQRFVETEDQLASDVCYRQDMYLEVSVILLLFSGVQHLEEEDEEEDEEAVEVDHPVAENKDNCVEGVEAEECHIKEEESLLTSGKLEKMVLSFMEEIVLSGQLPGGIGSMHVAIKKEKESQMAELESGSHDAVPEDLIEEIVHGNNGSLILGEKTRGYLKRYNELMEKDEAFWIVLIQKIFLDAPRADIIMVPDAKLAEKLAEQENEAVSERINTIGKETLAKIGKQHEERIASLKPEKFHSSLFPPIPSSSNITRWPYLVSRKTLGDYESQDVTIETDFVHCTILLDTSSLTLKQRIFLPILCDLMLTCDILNEDGSYVAYTDHSKAVIESTISVDYIGLGYDNDMAHQCISVDFVAMPENFAEAAELVMQTLFQCEVTAERVSAVSQSCVANATAEMREGDSVLRSAMKLLPYHELEKTLKDKVPNFVLGNFMGTYPLWSFLCEEFTRKKARKQVQRNILRSMNETLEAVRKLPSSDIFIQVAARDPPPAQEAIESLWRKKRSGGDIQLANGHEKRTANGKSNGLALTRQVCMSLSQLIGVNGIGRIIGISGVESSHFAVRVDSPVVYGHEDYCALNVAIELLCRMEGPLSNAVRDSGLAYGMGISNSVWRGHLTATIFESASPAAAWDAVCESLLDFRRKLDQDANESGLDVDLETAKAASLFCLTEKRSTPGSIAMGALSRTAAGVGTSLEADQAMEKGIEKVSLACLARVFDAHIGRLLDVQNRVAVTTCGQGVVEEVISGFKACSHPVILTECSVDSLFPSEVCEIVRTMKKALVVG